MIFRNKDGTYASCCALCGKPLSDPIFATTHFIVDSTHDLYGFSDAAMHWDCYAEWPEQERFASLYFEERVARAKTEPWPRVWPVIWSAPTALVQYGSVIDEVSVILKKSGTDMRIKRQDWDTWLSGRWREDCRPGLECAAIAEQIPQLAQLTLPQPIAPPNGGPAEPPGDSRAGGGPPSVS